MKGIKKMWQTPPVIRDFDVVVKKLDEAIADYQKGKSSKSALVLIMLLAAAECMGDENSVSFDERAFWKLPCKLKKAE